MTKCEGELRSESAIVVDDLGDPVIVQIQENARKLDITFGHRLCGSH